MKYLNFYKYILLSLICSSYLISSNIEEIKDFSKYPLSQDATSISRGGSISDKVASEDGVGTILIGGVGNDSNDVNNKIYNQTLKNNKDILSDTTNLKDLNINNSDLNKINENKFVKLDHQNNTVCDDNNPLTVGETYLNDKCQGGTLLHSDGENCNDGNVQTINDKYLNGICTDQKTNGSSCNDLNDATTGETWLNKICQGGVLEEGASCDDSDSTTVYDIVYNGVCKGLQSNGNLNTSITRATGFLSANVKTNANGTAFCTTPYQGANDCEKSFDNNTASTYWRSRMSLSPYIGFNFVSKKLINKVIVSGDYTIKGYDFLASNDGVNYNLLISGIIPSNIGVYTFTFTNKEKYNYYKLLIKSYYGPVAVVVIRELSFIEASY